MSIGNRIRELRESVGYSQTDFADKIDVSKQTLYKYENGIVTNIPSDRIEAIAKLCNVDPAYIMGWAERMLPSAAPSQDPLRDYYDRLIRYLDSSPAHRQLISDAAHVRAEDIDLARQFLTRLADPDSSAPDLPDLDTVKSTGSVISDTLDTSGDTSRDFQRDFQALPSSNHGQTADPQEALEKILRNARNSCDCADTHVELTDEALALVRDTPEVLKAEAEYIKKMSVKPRRKGATASPSTDAEGRKSG